MSQFPTFSSSDKAINMIDMGITYRMYAQLRRVCSENHCIIMVRKTNRGSVMPFHNRTAVGKKLPTKGKSSEAHFTSGNITFLAQMSKKMDEADWFGSQCSLISVLGEKTTYDNWKYAFIPRLLTIQNLEELLGNQKYTGTIGTDNIKVKIENDRIGGKTMAVEYQLKKTTWDEIEKEFKGENALTAPVENIQPGTVLYRVYVKVKSERDTFPLVCDYDEKIKTSVKKEDFSEIQNLKAGEKEITKTVDPEKKVELETSLDIPLKVIWEEALWGKKIYSKEKPIDDKIKADISDFKNCAPKLGTDGDYREVRVLGLFTRGGTVAQGGRRGNAAQKRFFEVVADYDLFMVSPDLGSGAFLITSNDVTFMKNGKTLSLMPKPGVKYKYRDAQRIDEDTKEALKENPYGLLSEYEMHIRKEVNKALGIKVAQHGIETANLFYTSDIADPVLVIYPNASSTFSRPQTAIGKGALLPVLEPIGSDLQHSGLCFFYSFKMLFEMMVSDLRTEPLGREIDDIGIVVTPAAQSPNGKDIKEKNELNSTYNIKLEYEPKTPNFMQQYPMIFNLNWGSPDYINFHKISPEKQARINQEVLPQIESQKRDLNLFYNGLLSVGNFEIEKQPLSIQALFLYLHKSYLILIECPNHRDPEGNRKKVVKFLGLFYAKVFDYLSTPQTNEAAWEGLKKAAGGKESKIENMKKIYEKAKLTIEKILEKSELIVEERKSLEVKIQKDRLEKLKKGIPIPIGGGAGQGQIRPHTAMPMGGRLAPLTRK